MGLFGDAEKKFCVKCERVLKPQTFVESMKGDKSENVEFSDGWYCSECAKKRKSKK